MNEQNLRPGEYKLSVEEAKKGGRASAEARRAKRDLRKALEMLDFKDLIEQVKKTKIDPENPDA